MVLVSLLVAGVLILGMPARLEEAFFFKYWIVSLPPIEQRKTISNVIQR